jgi:hypothetical protein
MSRSEWKEEIFANLWGKFNCNHHKNVSPFSPPTCPQPHLFFLAFIQIPFVFVNASLRVSSLDNDDCNFQDLLIIATNGNWLSRIEFWVLTWLFRLNFFFKSKRYHFSKKTKINELQLNFWPDLAGLTGIPWIFPFFIFFKILSRFSSGSVRFWIEALD